MYTIMLFVSQVNKAIVSTPGIGMNNTFRVYFAADDGLQGLSGTVRNYFRIDLATSLEKAKDRGFAISATTAVTLNSFGSEV
jgi:hypothetical protein